MESYIRLEDFDGYQGKALDFADAESIARLQKEFLMRELREGIAGMQSFECGRLSPENPLYRAFSGIKTLKEFVKSGAPFFLKIQAITNFYQDVHEFLRLDGDGEKLFFEFLLGLLRFEVVSQMSLYLAQKIDPNFEIVKERFANDDSDGFFESLRVPEEILNQVYVRVIATLDSDADGFWGHIERVVKSDTAFEQAAKALLKLHYLPGNARIMSMAQVLHWNGFGGEGEILNFFPELGFLSRQAVAYHNGVKSSGDMASRISWFFGIMGFLKLRSINVLAQAIRKLFPDRPRIRIFDSGSGDKLGAINGLKIAVPNIQVDVTAADVAGESLKKLLKFNESNGGGNLKVEKVVYQDLSGELDSGEFRDSYDVFSAGNVLHHLMDSRCGEENLAKVLRFATEIVRQGGLVYLQDVGEAAHLQFPVIPGNLVDREGCLPPNIYERLSFESVAVSADPGFVKVPYRLSDLWFKGPAGLSEDRGIYEANFFVVVRVPEREVRCLDQLRGRGSFAQCDEIVQNYFDISGLQRGVCEQVFNASG